MLILLSGRSGVGKSTVATFLRELAAFRVVNVGNILGAELRRRHVEWHARHEIGSLFLENYDATQIFPLLDEGLRVEQAAAPGASVAVDGVRFAVTCAQFRDSHPDSLIWFVTCDPSIRAARRLLGGDVRSANVGDSDEQLEQAADTVIRNDGTVDDLRTAVALLLANAD